MNGKSLSATQAGTKKEYPKGLIYLPINGNGDGWMPVIQ